MNNQNERPKRSRYAREKSLRLKLMNKILKNKSKALGYKSVSDFKYLCGDWDNPKPLSEMAHKKYKFVTRSSNTMSYTYPYTVASESCGSLSPGTYSYDQTVTGSSSASGLPDIAQAIAQILDVSPFNNEGSEFMDTSSNTRASSDIVSRNENLNKNKSIFNTDSSDAPRKKRLTNAEADAKSTQSEAPIANNCCIF